MATLSQLVERTRLELADTAKLFTQTIRTTGDAQVYELSYAPVLATSCTVYLDGVVVQDLPVDGVEFSGVQIEESTGKVIFDFYPPEGMDLTVTGTHFRYFTETELATVVGTAFGMHVKGRTDTFGRPILLERLDGIEEYPVALLATIQAVQVLMTDAAFDIDIYAPDGINIPRSQRHRQLAELLANLKDRYRDLSMALNIGLYKTEVYTLRRISARTNRYVPVYRPQEIDDRSRPQRVYLPTPSYGGTSVDDGITTLDLVINQGDTFSLSVEVTEDIPLGAQLAAQIRGYAGSPAIAGAFTIDIVSPTEITLSLPAAQTRNLPMRGVWDLQITYEDPTPEDPDNPEVISHTLYRGRVDSPREVTTSQAPGWTVLDVNGLTTQISPPYQGPGNIYGSGQLWPYP